MLCAAQHLQPTPQPVALLFQAGQMLAHCSMMMAVRHSACCAVHDHLLLQEELPGTGVATATKTIVLDAQQRKGRRAP